MSAVIVEQGGRNRQPAARRAVFLARAGAHPSCPPCPGPPGPRRRRRRSVQCTIARPPRRAPAPRRQRRERGADARHLRVADQAAEDLLEVRLLRARDDVLPAVGFQHAVARPRRAARRRRRCRRRRGSTSASAAACACRMPSTPPTSAIRSSTAASRAASDVELGVFAHPLELVDDRVLRFFLPVEQEDVLDRGRRGLRRRRCWRGSAPARTARCGRSARARPRCSCRARTRRRRWPATSKR